MRQKRSRSAKKPSVAETVTVEGRAEPSARDRLLAAATDLFYRQGIRSVGVDEIVAAADVAKMSLYRCFPSKDELVAAYLRGYDQRYWDWWDREVEHHPGDPRAQILALFQALARRAAKPGWRGCPFTNAATEFPEPDHPGRQVALANKQELRRRLRELALAAGARDPARLADQWLLLFEGAYASFQTFGAEAPIATAAAAAEALLDAQLAPGAPA